MAASIQTTEKNAPEKQEPPVTKITEQAKEFGGPKGPEPTRYGDWEKKGRCIDF